MKRARSRARKAQAHPPRERLDGDGDRSAGSPITSSVLQFEYHDRVAGTSSTRRATTTSARTPTGTLTAADCGDHDPGRRQGRRAPDAQALPRLPRCAGTPIVTFVNKLGPARPRDGLRSDRARSTRRCSASHTDALHLAHRHRWRPLPGRHRPPQRASSLRFLRTSSRSPAANAPKKLDAERHRRHRRPGPRRPDHRGARRVPARRDRAPRRGARGALGRGEVRAPGEITPVFFGSAR